MKFLPADSVGAHFVESANGFAATTSASLLPALTSFAIRSRAVTSMAR